MAKSENAREQEEVKKLRSLAADSQQEIVTIRRRVRNFCEEDKKKDEEEDF
jgi:hypothetical protein